MKPFSKTPEYMRQYNRKRRDMLRQNGLCIDCGKRAPNHGRVLCPVCIDYRCKQRIANARRAMEPINERQDQIERMLQLAGRCA